jgi:hypothetical protein
MTVQAIRQKRELALALTIAWEKYHILFGEQPHGTPMQMLALVALIPEEKRYAPVSLQTRTPMGQDGVREP